ncbi:LexA family transcriptional regulator [Campylobacter rectus]|uniref:LexA family transcriptional regulator n=1 Tax=Campylobacter rectus TaxID=203 RepID=UPI0028E610CE|nr:LexA family transcriptional regulator [Campylobacter rectus]
MKTFAQKIDELLKEKDINTIQLADILGISQSLVSQWLLGQKKTTKFLAPLPKFSGYPIEYFVNDNIETPDQIINNIKDDKNDRQKAIEGAIYVCRYDNELLVKRFKKRPHFALISDNRAYEPIKIEEDLSIEILGRVVGSYSINSKRF